MNGPTLIFSAAALLVAATPAPAPLGAFTGVYAPGTWTVAGAGIGGSSAVFSTDGSMLTITGGDGGIGSTISVTHAITVDSVWWFDWSYAGLDTTPGFDAGCYLHNGREILDLRCRRRSTPGARRRRACVAWRRDWLAGYDS